ncbi:hypothetical protein ACP4J5_17395 [Pseudomonas oryzihabitans]|uniref:hypothetical protein n=1 Tax=Pseudomonas oryzihabitans TaxID=47885 RepID=UPI003CFB4103
MNEAQTFIDNLQAYQQGLADMQAHYEGLIADGKLANPREVLERFAEELRYELNGDSVSITWTS